MNIHMLFVLLQYSRTQDNLLTIVLSATYTTGWVGIGFSKDGMMLNSSAMVGWITEKGVARIKQYYLAGFTPEEIKPDKGELSLTNVPPFVTVYGATIYLAFQLNFATSSSLSNKQAILLAFGTRYPIHHHLTLHNDKTTIRFDFSAGLFIFTDPLLLSDFINFKPVILSQNDFFLNKTQS